MTQTGRGVSPFAQGVAALWREPLLLWAELAWRWCFALAAWASLLYSGAVFLGSLQISGADELRLATLQPDSLATAAKDIFRGSLLRFTWMNAILLCGLTLLWAAAAAAGRIAVGRRLIAMFREDGEDWSDDAWHYRPVFTLMVLRGIWTWAAIGALAGSVLLGTAMLRQQHAARASAFFVFGTALACVFGYMLNWFFGLAPLFCVRNRSSAANALVETAEFCATRGGRVLGVSLAFLFLRLVWMATTFIAFLASVRLFQKIEPGWVMLLLGGIALAYFAGADLLYLARLATYAALAEEEAGPEPIAIEPSESGPQPDVLAPPDAEPA